MPRSSSSSTLLSRRDIEFLLYDWLDVEALLARTRFAEHSRETFDAVLELSAQIAAERFAPHNKTVDATEPVLVDGRVRLPEQVRPALDAAAEAGLISATMGPEVGGLALPTVVGTACQAWLQAANVGTWSYAFLSIANANLLLAHGSPEQVETFVRPQLEGRFHGTMCLSEPQAGSSLTDVTTRAQPQPDGSYRVFGSKMWISGGDHELGENIVHLVLAKIPGGPPGVQGISLLLVPKYLVGPDGAVGERNDVVVAGLNHKMGWRGTVNTLLNFGEGAHTPGGAPGAVGYLVGPPHQGLAHMFHMMNEARIGVGTGAAALGYTAYLKALDYARTRPQGRPPGAKDPAQPQVPLIAHADVRRMLLAQKCYAEGALGLVLYCGRLVDVQRTATTPEEGAHAGLLLEVLTPIAKSWPSQWCLAGNDLAIQVHGGYGYTREYDVEQHYRDNRLNAIHEGTHGIQALDLLGRKVAMDGGAGFAALVALIRATATRAAESASARAATAEPADGSSDGSADGDQDAAELAADLHTALDRLVEVTTIIHRAAAAPDVKLANASLYLEAAGHIVLAWVWLEQFLATGTRTDDFHRGKRQAARYFFRYELPRVHPQLTLLARLDRLTVDTDEAWF